MKPELDKSKASFKLDLMETANADPILSGADFKVLAAYASVLAWPSARTWLATSLATAMTGLSDRQFRASRSVLRGKNEAGRAYLLPARSGGDVATYTLVNPWRDEARAHIEAMTGYHKAVSREKKAQQRAKLSRKKVPGQNADCPGKICRSVPAEIAAYTPSIITPREEGSRVKNMAASNVVVLSLERVNGS